MEQSAQAQATHQLMQTHYGGTRLLLVDDEPSQLTVQRRLLASCGFLVDAVDTPQEALRRLDSGRYDILLADLSMPHLDGVSLIGLAKAQRPELVCVILTAAATVDSAVQALKVGASDYLFKPFDLLRVLPVLDHAIAERDLRREQRRADAALDDNVVVVSNLMLQLDEARALAEQVSDAKSAFIGALSEAMRGPLNSIIGFAHVLREAPPELEAAEGRRFIDHIATAGAQLLAQLDGARDLSRFAHGALAMTMQALDVTALLRVCVRLVAGGADYKRLNVVEDYPGPLWARADAARLRQAVLALLNDAILCSAKGARVLVQLRRHGDTVELAIVNDKLVNDPAREPAATTPGQTGRRPDWGLPLIGELVLAMQGQMTRQRSGDGSRVSMIALAAADAP